MTVPVHFRAPSSEVWAGFWQGCSYWLQAIVTVTNSTKMFVDVRSLVNLLTPNTLHTTSLKGARAIAPTTSLRGGRKIIDNENEATWAFSGFGNIDTTAFFRLSGFPLISWSRSFYLSECNYE